MPQGHDQLTGRPLEIHADQVGVSKIGKFVVPRDSTPGATERPPRTWESSSRSSLECGTFGAAGPTRWGFVVTCGWLLGATRGTVRVRWRRGRIHEYGPGRIGSLRPR
jgi:hypothetical protein